jgi:membrane-anchored protein YejM (alkaline phosphatase superfamily)
MIMAEQEEKTVVELLFLEFKTLATNMRFAGDESGAGLIDFLCEREVDALRKEQEQIQKAYKKGYNDALDAVDSIINKVTKIKQNGIN